MCNFKSAWYLESGELVHAHETDGHEYLALARGIKSGFVGMDRAVRVELLPPSNQDDIADISKWNLHLDELTAPDWWEDKKDDCLRQISAVVKSSIVTDERACLIGGSWVITKEARVRSIIGGRVISAAGANLENAYLWSANLRDANLENANLGNANLRDANLGYANLRDANLENANLGNANLGYANLENANLGNANLGYANLRDANLWDANLENARRLLDDTPIPGWQVVNGFLKKV